MSTGMSTDLFGTESMDPLDRKIALPTAVRTLEFDKKGEPPKYRDQPKTLAAAKPVYVTNVVDQDRLEAQQLELYEIDE